MGDGRAIGGEQVPLPDAAAEMIGRLDGVLTVAPTAELPGVHAYRNDRIPTTHTSGLSIRAVDEQLLSTLDAALAGGRFLTSATGQYQVAVLGDEAAARLGRTGSPGASRRTSTPSAARSCG